MVELHNKYSAQGFGTSPKLSPFPICIPLEYNFTSYTQKHTHTDIIAFPCNQFGYQEKGCEVDIKEFAKKKGFNGTMMSKISVVCYSFVCALIFVPGNGTRMPQTSTKKSHEMSWEYGLGIMSKRVVVSVVCVCVCLQNGSDEHPVFSFLKNQPGCNGNIM